MKRQRKKRNSLKNDFVEKMNRRDFLEGSAKLGLLASSIGFPNISLGQPAPPNILMIPIDDLNDWIGPLGGYAGVKTPNMGRLAKISKVYTRAYSNVPACSPSRTSTLFGMLPTTHGVYTNDEEWQLNPFLNTYDSIPKHFKKNGYYTVGTGKIFHSYKEIENEGVDPTAWDEYQFCHSAACDIKVSADGDNPIVNGKKVKLSQYAKTFGGNFDFGPYYSTSDVPDFLRANWMAQNILNRTHTKPFFATCGIFKPHLPFIVPQQFFDLYPLENIVYPRGVLDSVNNTRETNADISDLGPLGKRINSFLSDHTRLIQTGEWKAIIRSYLAAISFADHCLGVLLDAVLNGPNKNNTIIVLWSDHGWQLGEKLAWRKFTLWERALRIPMMFSGPGIQKGVHGMPVSLMDLYPTLADLAFGAVPTHLQGKSLKNNLLNNKHTHFNTVSIWRERPAFPNGGPHFSVRNVNYRYIQYQSGEQELYDHRVDRYEFNNLLSRVGGRVPTEANITVGNNMKKYIPSGPYAPRRGAITGGGGD